MLNTPWPGSSTPITIIQHSAQINHGNSGGPLLDACRRVIGINTEVVPSGEDGVQPGISFASSTAVLARQLAHDLPQLRVRIDHGGCGADGKPVAINGAAPPPDATPSLAPSPAAQGIGAVRGMTFAVVVLGIVGVAVATAFALQRQSAAKAGRAGWRLQVETPSGDRREWPVPVSAPRGRFRIGRQTGVVDFVIEDDYVSRYHLDIEFSGGQVYVLDAGSSGGTRINGVDIGSRRTELLPGQTIELGKSRLRLNRR